MVEATTALDIERNKGDFFYPETHLHDAGIGLTEETIHYISNIKDDPQWVRDLFGFRRARLLPQRPRRRYFPFPAH